MEKAGIPWSAPVAVEEIPDTGLHRTIEAPEDVRAAIAKLAGLRALPCLTGEFDLERRGAAVHVTGRIQARVGQTCVITLEPIENEIDEAVDLLFTPAAATAKIDLAPAESAEPPDVYSDGQIDLGSLATEFLMLGIDPYPRKPGAQFASPKVEDAGDRPFAALEALKKRLGPA
jgi:uncharacterized metal-binding protein YceD (DUF177 family)